MTDLDEQTPRSTVERLSAGLHRASLAIAGLAVVLTMLHSTANALLRTYGQTPLSGTLEYVGGWYMPAVVFFGLVVAQQRGDHIEANLLMSRAPASVQRYYQRITDVTTILVLVAVGWFSLLEALEQQRLGTVVGVTEIPQWPVVYFVPLGAALFALQLVVDLVAGRGGGSSGSSAPAAPSGSEAS